MSGVFVNLNCLFGYGTVVYVLKLQLLASNDFTCLVNYLGELVSISNGEVPIP